MQIRIKSTPRGEAPENIRQAWIGLVIPVTPRFSGKRTATGFGVLSGPKSRLGRRIALMLGRGIQYEGYTVEADVALNLLASHSPEAATWWRTNAPKFVSPGRYFLFNADSCEEIQ
jgi:hypothetical protein